MLIGHSQYIIGNSLVGPVACILHAGPSVSLVIRVLLSYQTFVYIFVEFVYKWATLSGSRLGRRRMAVASFMAAMPPSRLRRISGLG